MDIMEIGAKIGVYYVPFLFALCFHEFAHGWVAKMRGDNTAQMMGRLTMNPGAHIDILGTVVLPLMAIVFNSPIFFGWAKPVPVNARNLKSPRKDMFWVALAGPLSNLLLAIVAAFVIGFIARFFAITEVVKSLVQILNVFIMTNLFLAVFNLIPLNPLDGGKVIARFLPAHINYKLEQNEQVTSLILMVLVLTGALTVLSVPVMWGRDFLMNAALGGLL
ncbi:MAG: site-2 protease family protein [Bdellovibrionaceae bacterium]|nr:site-2 protease family protein [Pseudobdellovibrionaceae bacterium]